MAKCKHLTPLLFKGLIVVSRLSCLAVCSLVAALFSISCIIVAFCLTVIQNAVSHNASSYSVLQMALAISIKAVVSGSPV